MLKGLSEKELRDYFAAEALNGILAGRGMVPVRGEPENLAEQAFDLANAMCEQSKLRSLFDSEEGSGGIGAS